MVNQVTSQNVTAILNSNTSRVAELKKKFTLGSIGYNLFKLFSCFISNSNPTKQAIQKAETIDKMPTLIKKTAEKISKLLKKEEFSPGIISQRGELLASRTEAYDMSGASVKGVKQTNKLQDAMLTLTSQAKKLADAYGHSNTSASAYVQALSGLVKQDFDISGQNYLVLSAIQSYTDAFAAKGAFEVATGLDTFISEMHEAFKDLSPEFITTHIYRQLSETNLSSKIEGSKAL
ncbi:MAG: hypothetical protein EBZ47_09295, partial [Chlamydiae bacterium]|nr:hypothetical protein [Chlamydiota bacterium]